MLDWLLFLCGFEWGWVVFGGVERESDEFWPSGSFLPGVVVHALRFINRYRDLSTVLSIYQPYFHFIDCYFFLSTKHTHISTVLHFPTKNAPSHNILTKVSKLNLIPPTLKTKKYSAQRRCTPFFTSIPHYQ